MTTPSLPVVGLDELQAVLDHGIAYDAVRVALASIASGDIDAPRELALKLRNDGEIHIKGGWLVSQPHVVFKIASGGFPAGGNAGCSILLDAQTGAPEMIFDDKGWLTDMRTAAAGAVAADLLAVEGPVAVAILGTGVQARFQLEALRDRREVHSVTVWGRDPAKTRNLASDVSATPCVSVADAVANADVVVTTTSATEPILLAEHLRPGMHITAMGADMVGKRELAAEVLARADVIAADDPSTCARAGELQHAPDLVGSAVELASLSVAAPGSRARRSRSDITVADLCGLGAYDASIAAAAVASLGL